MKNFGLLLSWLSSKHILLRFEYNLPEMITDGHLGKFWRKKSANWLFNAFCDGIHDQILQFRSVQPNRFVIDYLTLGTRARIKTSDLFEMNDSKNEDFYNALSENQIVTIECNRILKTDDISITIEIPAEQKIVRIIRIDECIRLNQLHVLKSNVRRLRSDSP